MTIARRDLLAGGLAGLGAALAGCSTTSGPTGSATSTSSTPTQESAGRSAMARIEERFDGRLGVYALDTGTGRTVAHRADERFLVCSTAKALLVAMVLHQSLAEPDLLARRIHYTRRDVLDYAPVTRRHLDTGMTVADLCHAALTVSDNTAANLLYAQVGGPEALTRFARGLGDRLTRFDRTEPDLNDSAGPDDQRDTTTPRHFADDLRALALAGPAPALPDPQRTRFVGWMRANTTGADQIRAGAPDGWQIADKTGSGSGGEANDVAVLWPPRRAPIVLAVYTQPTDPDNTSGAATIVAATRAALAALSGER